MSTLKTRAKQAKERMKYGFWEEAKRQLEDEKQVAATMGIDTSTVIQQNRERIALKINNSDEYAGEIEFFNKVKEILESDTTICNPLQLLADHKLLATMNQQEKQCYFLKLSNRYRKAVEKYNASR